MNLKTNSSMSDLKKETKTLLSISDLSKMQDFYGLLFEIKLSINEDNLSNKDKAKKIAESIEHKDLKNDLLSELNEV